MVARTVFRYDLSKIYHIELLEHHDRATEKVFKARTIRGSDV